ncbi:MAG TPA: DUF1015 family protein [Spirochaetota bacterium]|nr:DUF1015 family protein [Spirochaetota bacterium]
MAKIREFAGLRPERGLAVQVAELPYDVVSSEEARAIAKNRPHSFFHISKPEIDFPESVSPYDDRVYAKARENFERFIGDGVLRGDDEPGLYLYTLVMGGREQTGVVGCLDIDDYLEDRIKKHELTREDKERDRMRHVDSLSAQTGLVFTFYRENGAGRPLFARALEAAPEVDFTSEDGIRHMLRRVSDGELIASFKELLRSQALYIADGHHRAAAAVKVGLLRRKANPNHTGEEEYNRFLAVVFPHEQLKILPYNRVVRDLNGQSVDEFLERLGQSYSIEDIVSGKPPGPRRICMYLRGRWRLLTPRSRPEGDIVARLDVSVLQKTILEPLLGIGDPRKDMRIDFVGGIRGPAELERLVRDGGFAVAFSLFPTSIEELIAVADNGGLMPPKSTWFEPKLRSGLAIHRIERIPAGQ